MHRREFLALTIACAAAGVASAAEPLLGGPCDGCENALAGMPKTLAPRARIAPAGETGEPLVIEGVVRDAKGAPAAGVVVYAYHTDATGIYPRAGTRHGRLRGWVRTGADGAYRFDTIRPGAYPGRDIPQHVHMHVIEPGRGHYYIDDLLFDDDARLTADYRRRLDHARGGSGIAHPTRDADGAWHARRDIVLGAGIGDYPAN